MRNAGPQEVKRMKRNHQQGNKARKWSGAVAVLMAAAMVLSLAATVSAHHKEGHTQEPPEEAIAEIEVEWHEDGMGFDVTSDKEISNVIVEDCFGVTHKHDNINEKTFDHRENFTIAGIWVKSGANHAGEGAPPGAGERFDNPEADCPPVATPTDGPEPCIGPQHIEAHTDGPVNVVNWSEFEGADSYNLYRSESGEGFLLLTTTDENTTEYRDDLVEPGTSYTYAATAMVDGNETQSCDTVTITAIPFLPGLAAGALAAVGGVGAYAFARRRS